MKRLFFLTIILLIKSFVYIEPVQADIIQESESLLKCDQKAIEKFERDYGYSTQKCTKTIKRGTNVSANEPVELKSFTTQGNAGGYPDKPTTITTQIQSDNNGQITFCSLIPNQSLQEDLFKMATLQKISILSTQNISYTIDPDTSDVCSVVPDPIQLEGSIKGFNYYCSPEGACTEGSQSPDPNVLPVYSSTKNNDDAKNSCTKQCGIWGRKFGPSGDLACVFLSPAFPNTTLTDLKEGRGGQDNSMLGEFKSFHPTEQACKENKYGLLFEELPKKQIKPSPTDTPIPPRAPCTVGETKDETRIDLTTDEGKARENEVVRCVEMATAIGPINVKPEELLQTIFITLLGISGGIALLIIIYSGYLLTSSRGNPEQIQKAREWLTSAIVGLLFMIFSVVILEIIGVDILAIPGLSQ